MDGVLIDSESKYAVAIDRMLERNQFRINREQRLSFIGTSAKINAARLKEWFPEDPRSVEELTALYAETIFTSLREDVDGLIDGLDEWIAALRARGIKTALASSSVGEMVDYTTEKFDLRGRMDGILSARDIRVAKPDPEIFLKAAARVGVDPADCLVIEDSQHGINAAKAAGMTCASFTGAPRIFDDVYGADLEIARYDSETFERIFGK